MLGRLQHYSISQYCNVLYELFRAARGGAVETQHCDLTVDIYNFNAVIEGPFLANQIIYFQYNSSIVSGSGGVPTMSIEEVLTQALFENRAATCFLAINNKNNNKMQTILGIR